MRAATSAISSPKKCSGQFVISPNRSYRAHAEKRSRISARRHSAACRPTSPRVNEITNDVEVASVSAKAFSDHNLYHLVERNLNPSFIMRAQLIRATSWFAAAALPSTAANFHVRNLIDARTAPFRGGERFGD